MIKNKVLTLVGFFFFLLDGRRVGSMFLWGRGCSADILIHQEGEGLQEAALLLLGKRRKEAACVLLLFVATKLQL